MTDTLDGYFRRSDLSAAPKTQKRGRLILPDRTSHALYPLFVSLNLSSCPRLEDVWKTKNPYSVISGLRTAQRRKMEQGRERGRENQRERERKRESSVSRYDDSMFRVKLAKK